MRSPCAARLAASAIAPKSTGGPDAPAVATACSSSAICSSISVRCFASLETSSKAGASSGAASSGSLTRLPLLAFLSASTSGSTSTLAPPLGADATACSSSAICSSISVRCFASLETSSKAGASSGAASSGSLTRLPLLAFLSASTSGSTSTLAPPLGSAAIAFSKRSTSSVSSPCLRAILEVSSNASASSPLTPSGRRGLRPLAAPWIASISAARLCPFCGDASTSVAPAATMPIA